MRRGGTKVENSLLMTPRSIANVNEQPALTLTTCTYIWLLHQVNAFMIIFGRNTGFGLALRQFIYGFLECELDASSSRTNWKKNTKSHFIAIHGCFAFLFPLYAFVHILTLFSFLYVTRKWICIQYGQIVITFVWLRFCWFFCYLLA